MHRIPLNAFWKQWLSGRKLLVFISIMALCHLIAMIFYTQYTKSTRQALDRDQIIEQMITTIEHMRITPPRQRLAYLKSLYYPLISMELSDTPLFSEQITDGLFWQLEKKLHHQQYSIEVSYLLSNQQWLNLKAKIDSNGLELQLFLILAELIVAGALLFSAWSVARFTVPLNAFKDWAERVGLQTPNAKFSTYGPSIVRETAKAMQQMQERLHNLLENRNKMLAAISHDLRTPLTRLKLRVQLIDADIEKNKLIKDLDEMEMMIDQILSYAKAQHQQEPHIRLDLNSFLHSLCADLQDLGHDIDYHGPEKKITVNVRKMAFKRAIHNLIDNAQRVANHVEISLTLSKEEAVIEIADNGPGIPEEELPKVFEPFYRTDSARTPRINTGVGLGLSLVRDVIHHHQGKVLLSNRLEGGLCVRIELPIEPSSTT